MHDLAGFAFSFSAASTNVSSAVIGAGATAVLDADSLSDAAALSDTNASNLIAGANAAVPFIADACSSVIRDFAPDALSFSGAVEFC